MRRLLALVACLVVAGSLGVPRVRAQAAPPIAVIVHKDVPIDGLTIGELRKILLGDREFWTSGLRITLLIRAPIARERDAAVQTICEMTEAQFRQHWIGKVFRAETATGPKIVYSGESAVETVARTPGAIAFVEAPLAKGVKTLKIDGLLPGQSGYKLK